MRKKSIVAVNSGAALLCLAAFASASQVNFWDFKAYGGFAQLHSGDFPNPGYHVVLTPLPPRTHEDMGAFYWSTLAVPSLLGINQKEPLIHGQSWKAPGRYYGEKNPIRPGITSIHGETIGEIETDDDMGEVIGWTTHYNNWIPNEFKGGKVAVNYHLLLFEPGSDVPAWDSGEMFFFMDVFETDNSLECCPDGNYKGIPPNINDGCADRFRVGVLDDFDGDGDIDVDDLDVAPEPGACFDELIITNEANPYTFSYDGVNYNVYLTGFWEVGDPDPILKGEGWSPEGEFIHFEVRAEVWVYETASGREAAECVDNPSVTSCTPATEPD